MALLVCSLSSTPVRAQEFDTALKQLASEDFEAFSRAITTLGDTGDARALSLLQALDAGSLRIDAKGSVFIVEGGKTKPALDGGAAPEGALRSPPVNNVVRRVLGPALAKLQLSSPDRKVRLAAANELAKSTDAGAAPLLRQSIGKETDSEIESILSLALAKIDLNSEKPEVRIQALKVIEDDGTVALQSAVEGMLAKNSDGSYREPNGDVRAAAVSALGAINSKIFWVNLLANSLYGVSLGSVLVLAALGLAITFGLMRVINMAHGEMIMLGAYSTYVVQNLFTDYLPEQFDLYLIAALPVAFAVTALVGAGLERGVIRFLYGRPLETLLATWGLSLMLIQAVRSVFGAQNVTVANPQWLSGGWELLPNLVLPYSRIAVVLFVIVVVGFVYFLLQRTPLGLNVRAVTQNREMAAGMGIATRRVDTWTFALGSGVAGLGGVALSQLGNVGPELGQGYIVDSFMVVVVGGVGNIAGTVAGAMGLGFLNKYLEPAFGAVLGKILILALLILFIQKRPQGLFALKGRAAEA
ncbi:MAG TPA: urea ABC transporter permease subunit UrtB [Polyangiaceae bacterium]